MLGVGRSLRGTCTNNMCNGRFGIRAANKKICLEVEEVVQNLLLARIHVLNLTHGQTRNQISQLCSCLDTA
jgi:hypothetical protein